MNRSVDAPPAGRRYGPLGELDREGLGGEPLAAAGALLGAVLRRRWPDGAEVLARVVEVEAYGPDDPASHSYRGPTPRCAAMFARAGTAYVYRSYGVHWCLNVSVGPEGQGAAVLLRAAAVLTGEPHVRRRRPHVRTPAALLRGPGCLTAGLDIDAGADGSDLLADGQLCLLRDGYRVAHASGPRVGVSVAVERPWRLYVPDCAAVSRYRRSPRAG